MFVRSHLHSPLLWTGLHLSRGGGGEGCWDSRQVTLFEALQSFLHPGCAEAAGGGGRAPLQGLGGEG